MKLVSLQLEDKTYQDATEITSKMQVATDSYINEAISLYNKFNSRRLLKAQLTKESKDTWEDAKEILLEFEQLMDANETV